MRALWYMLIYGRPKVPKEAAIAIIQEETYKRGWNWFTPVEAYRRKSYWEVRTNLHGRGSVWGKVDCETGEIKYIGHAPR